MIDKSYLGRTFPPLSVDVEKWQLQFFAKAVGETNPIYFDEVAAQAEGYRSILAPPTYAVSLSLAEPDPFAKFVAMGINLGKILHAQQQFQYYGPICAGDRVTFQTTVLDIYEKRGGALQFMTLETVAINQFEEMTTRFKQTVVERNGPVGKQA